MTGEEIIRKGKQRRHGKRRGKKSETFLEAQQRKEAALADLREVELKERVGALVSAEDVNHWIGGMIIKSREVLMRIAPELKDRLSQESNPIKIEQIIEGEIRRALDELAQFKG